MTDREATRLKFLQHNGFAEFERHPLPGDASTRRYERLSLKHRRLILMDQPSPMDGQPIHANGDASERQAAGYMAMARLSGGRMDAFVGVADYLRGQGLSAPEILAVDTDKGLLVCEDLGDGLFADFIAGGQDARPMYLAAIETLVRLHTLTPPDVLSTGWPLMVYDDLALKTGADLFIEWWPQYDPTHPIGEAAAAEWERLWAPLRKRAEAGASVFIHRDFHAENLLWLPEREGVARVGLIDFQDALRAHPSWDLLSLLQDARRDVSPELEAACLDHYFALRPELDREAFMRDYTALASLNECRILGVFARLVIRDKKPRYEAFMPRMWGHLARNLEAPGMEGLKDWFHANGFGDKL